MLLSTKSLFAEMLALNSMRMVPLMFAGTCQASGALFCGLFFGQNTYL